MTVAPVLVADGLFELTEDGACLLGSRCRGCRALYFPQALSCRNPQCDDKSVEGARLPVTGTLVTFTVQRYRPPPLFRMDDWSPYAIGLVDLGEGLEVMGMIDGIALDEIRIGMTMRLIGAPLFARDDGVPVLTYKFAHEVAA